MSRCFMGTIAKTEKIRLLFSAYNNMTRRAISFQGIAELRGLLRTVWRVLCVSKSLFASLYKRLKTLVLYSEMKWSCFIWKGVFMKRTCRCMKHGSAVWSGTLCHEAKPFQASFFLSWIKKTQNRSFEFYSGQKNGGRSRTRIYDLHDVNVTL